MSKQISQQKGRRTDRWARFFPRVLITSLALWAFTQVCPGRPGLHAFADSAAGPSVASSKPVTLTLFHTNDLHSHFRPEGDELNLGGVARLKTLLTQLKGQFPHSLLVDGGDWSEGQAYYNLGAGVETLRMMDHLGYDVAVVGNHDWLNGPDVLLNIFKTSQAKLNLLGANLSFENYSRGAEFRKLIPPYVIREVAGAKIAFIGLCTYQFIYDQYMKPVKLLPPADVARELSRRLRPEVDVIVLISHNNVAMNEQILKATPEADLVIGAHDHLKLIHPVRVTRAGHADGWIVETGSWGRYLGQVDLTLSSKAISPRRLTLSDYRLHPVSPLLAEDPETSQQVETLEAELERTYGPIFHDEVAESEIELDHTGSENLIGSFVTDAYRSETGADLALDHINFIFGDLHAGKLRTVDFLNTIPAVYHPESGKSWTLKTFQIRGSTLSWLFNLIHTTQTLSLFGSPAASGLEVVYDPLFRNAQDSEEAVLPSQALPSELGLSAPAEFHAFPVIQKLLIQGAPVKSSRLYTLAAGGGLIESVEFLNRILPGAIPLLHLKETAREDWRVLADYAHAHSPIRADLVSLGRTRTQAPDLAVLQNDIRWEPLSLTSDQRILAKVRVRVRNLGASPYQGQGSEVRILGTEKHHFMAEDVKWTSLAAPKALPALAPLASTELEWLVTIPGEADLYPVSLSITAAPGEVDIGNNQLTRWWRTPAQFH